MSKSINTTAVYAVFAKADKSQAELATQLFNLGIFSRAEATPYVVAYIEQAPAYKGAKSYMGQRGLTFKKDSAPHAALKRILDNCFEKVSKPRTSNNKTDVVKSLVTSFNKLTKAEQRRFLASI